MDVDEMIIKVSTADEVAAANNGGAADTPGISTYNFSSIWVYNPLARRPARGLERDREWCRESLPEYVSACAHE
jgi:hypothetical protein